MNSSENRISSENLWLSVLIFLPIVITSAYSQISSETISNSLKLKEHNSKIYSKSSDKINKDSSSKSFEFPLQLSFEYGYGIQKFDNGYKDNNYRVWILGIDVNLFQKIIFLTLEYGEEKDVKVKNDDKGIFLSIGPKIRYLKTTHHNLFVHAGVLPSLAVIGGIEISSKYLYSFNPYIGASVGIKYFYTGTHRWIFMSGIQIFTN